jgi:hypothetical protein
LRGLFVTAPLDNNVDIFQAICAVGRRKVGTTLRCDHRLLERHRMVVGSLNPPLFEDLIAPEED